MVFQTVKTVSTAYTANVPNTRNLKDKIPLLGDLRRVQLTIKLTCSTGATAPTYALDLAEKERLIGCIRNIKYLMSSGSEEFIFTRGRHLFAMHALLNTEKFYVDTMPTGISTASADYRAIALQNKMHLDSHNEYLYFDFELADITEIVTAGILTVTNIEVVIGFEYYNKRSEFAQDFGIETNKVDQYSVVTGGLREISGLTLGRLWLGTFIDAFSNSTINLDKIKVSDNGVTIIEASYYEYLSKHLEITKGLMELVDFENQLWYVPESPIRIDNTTKLEVQESSTRNTDFIHLWAR